MSIAPLAATALWVKEAISHIDAEWVRLPFVGLLLVMVVSERDHNQFAAYFVPWCGTVLIGAVLIGLLNAVRHLRPKKVSC